MPGYKSKIAVLVLLIVVLTGQIPLGAAILSPELENFIRKGKEVTILLAEAEKEFSIISLNSARLYRADDSSYLDLEEGAGYTFRLEGMEKEYYNIQVFATRDEDKAAKILMELDEAGYPEGIVVKENGLYKVRLGNFQKWEDCLPVIHSLQKTGWETWPVKIVEKWPENIYVFKDGERIFQGSSISFNGSFRFDGGIFKGKHYIEKSLEGLNMFTSTGLDDVVAGIMGRVFHGIEIARNNSLAEIMKAYSIVLRTNILSYFFNEQIISTPLYGGLTEEEQVLKSVQSTSGIILGREEEDGRVRVEELNDVELFTYPDAALVGRDYQEILERVYGSSLFDLKKISNEKLLVDAEVAWGLKYKEVSYIDWQGPVFYTILDLDLNRRNLYFQPVLARGQVAGLESLEAIVRRTGALAGINGGYFDSTRPLGLLYIDNTIVSEPVKDRTALLLTEDNRVIFDRVSWQGYLVHPDVKLQFHGVNRRPGNNQITVFNAYYGKEAPPIKLGMVELVVQDNLIKKTNYYIDNNSNSRGSEIPDNGYIIQTHGKACQDLLTFRPGDPIYLENLFEPDFNEYRIRTAISAGPRLLKDGKISISSREEEFQADIAVGRAPRSAVGLTRDNRLVFFTIDGRQPGYSVGVTLQQLAEFMKNYGVVDGMNLDGGNSASMVVRGFTMNNPLTERLINNAIIIGKEEIKGNFR